MVLFSDVLLATDDQSFAAVTRLSIQAIFNSSVLDEIEVTLLCNSGTPGRATKIMKAGDTYQWSVSDFEGDKVYCQSYTSSPRGFSVEYQASGDAVAKSDENGCQYANVMVGQELGCSIKVTQDHVPLTVYKNWIGASGDEADVLVELTCDGEVVYEPLYVNEGLAATWQISGIPSDGLTCKVTEFPSDLFIPEESDCQQLILLPGRGDACTMVNTKVVKRIDMLNRYGKVIMILVMLTAGLIGVRRYV